MVPFIKIEHRQGGEQGEEFSSVLVEFASLVRGKYVSLELRRETQKMVNKPKSYLFLSDIFFQGGKRDYSTKVCNMRREG